jgi:hypothetical protein
MKRWKPTLIVLGLFAALLAYVLLVEVKKEPPSEGDVTPTPPPLMDYALGDLRAMRITDGQRTLRLEQGAEEWRITEPAEGAADYYALLAPVDDLLHLQATMIVVEQASDLATYGLDPPAITLIVELTSGQEERVLVGRKTPDGSTFYVQRVGDARVYTVSNYKVERFVEWLSAPPYQPTPTPEAG